MWISVFERFRNQNLEIPPVQSVQARTRPLAAGSNKSKVALVIRTPRLLQGRDGPGVTRAPYRRAAYTYVYVCA
ncbi:hypothetical protein EVAR_89624_1 [Eumeta japonica]|uniref:Uncharacterized protein n=1 Tax=Eumeta variegata TaxID=151549 RepID=A0A4C1ZCL6_EUMVA|nr:hypothetical protein EVAR_89624_1 [Eumeta japonica]